MLYRIAHRHVPEHGHWRGWHHSVLQHRRQPLRWCWWSDRERRAYLPPVKHYCDCAEHHDNAEPNVERAELLDHPRQFTVGAIRLFEGLGALDFRDGPCRVD